MPRSNLSVEARSARRTFMPYKTLTGAQRKAAEVSATRVKKYAHGDGYVVVCLPTTPAGATLVYGQGCWRSGAAGEALYAFEST
jgi:hypothetical protein